MDAAHTLIRTAVRTFFPEQSRKVLIVDALLLHSVLPLEDLGYLIGSPSNKETRGFIKPLLSARLAHLQQKTIMNVNSQRGSPKDYYYINFHSAINAIKYRIAKLRKTIESQYLVDESKKKDWQCPRCKAEYDDMEILDKADPERGFVCEKCGSVLVQKEEAREGLHSDAGGNHIKIRQLNTELAKFDQLIAQVDSAKVPENDFETAWERKTEVPKERQAGFIDRSATQMIMDRKDPRGGNAVRKIQDTVDTKNLSISLTSGEQREKEMEEEKQRKKEQLAKQNLLPVWHTKSAIGPGGPAGETNVKQEEGSVADLIKKEDGGEEKKVDVQAANMQDELAAYMAEMERERQLEQERKAAESTDDEEDDEERGSGKEDDDDDEGDFEDVVATPPTSSNSKTPGKSKLGGNNSGRMNGIKRERQDDDDSAMPSANVSGSSSDANTPASIADSRDSKRVKFENGSAGITNLASSNRFEIKKEEEDVDSDEDEDFEDAV